MTASKKQKCFEMFSLGKKPSDQEVKGLGLSPKTRYNYFQEWKKLSPGGGQPIAAAESSAVLTTPGGVVRFAPMSLTCQYTPIMYTARQAAVEQWGWPADLSLEDFLDTCLYHVFKDRGIILEGYIVEEEVEKQQ